MNTALVDELEKECDRLRGLWIDEKNKNNILEKRVKRFESALRRIENCMFHYETYGPEATIAGCVCTANLALEGTNE